jgi:hypothetical protein
MVNDISTQGNGHRYYAHITVMFQTLLPNLLLLLQNELHYIASWQSIASRQSNVLECDEL